jgi:L,D-peptidoglycan transpeptidase YkuD (ErfK/YbiS/YcfS/YnhG family)
VQRGGVRLHAVATAMALLTLLAGAGAGDRSPAFEQTSLAGGAGPLGTLPEAIEPAARVRQLVTVTSPAWSSTSGTLRAWQRRPGGEWVQVHRAGSIVIGYAGWVRASQRRQSTGTTPAGLFTLPYAFGRLPDPGGQLNYRQYDRNDWWPYEPRDPATYNVYQLHRAARTHWRADYSERLADYRRQYAYAVVVGFNLPSGVHYSARRHQRVATSPADTSRGGGIFLHVADDGLTAGCVAMPRTDVRWLVRWLDPDRHPRVAMGPRKYVAGL